MGRCTRRGPASAYSRIVGLYDTLITLRPSPVVALNRAIAIAQHEGVERGLDAIHAIDDRDRLTTYSFYFAALGDMELRRERRDAARLHRGRPLTARAFTAGLTTRAT